jgi:hypothetical protein
VDTEADLLGPVASSRCPSCAATLREGAPWCTLCFADLRPAPAPPPVDLPVPTAAAYGLPAPDPLTAPTAELGLPEQVPVAPTTVPGAPDPTWPCATCGAANGLTADVCAACGAGFLAGLRETEAPLLALPVVGDLGAMSRAQRLGLAAALVLAVVALTALLGFLTA